MLPAERRTVLDLISIIARVTQSKTRGRCSAYHSSSSLLKNAKNWLFFSIAGSVVGIARSGV